jgi:hypothetical protein
MDADEHALAEPAVKPRLPVLPRRPCAGELQMIRKDGKWLMQGNQRIARTYVEALSL